MGIIGLVVVFLRAFLLPRAVIAAENLALRQQLAVLGRSGRRPRLRRGDRVFGVRLSILWSGWPSSLLIVKPETVVRWHWWRNKREQMVLKAEDVLRRIESAGYQVTGGRESIGDGQGGALRVTARSIESGERHTTIVHTKGMDGIWRSRAGILARRSTLP